MKNKRGTQNKIELLNCHLNSPKCKHHLSLINQNYALAHDFLVEKDYFNSINSLKCAFKIATGINDTSCMSCARFFRNTLTESLENISGELKKMSSGLFAKKQYRTVYAEACNVLNEFKSNNISDNQL